MLTALAVAAAQPQQAQAQQTADADTALASLVAAELEFAAHAAREGIRAAFIANLADGATMFAPDPVDGRAWSRARPETGAQLSWYPSHAEVSAAGDLGFTTGPSQYRAGGAGDTLVHHGHFTSIWRRNADGVWKVELDLGTPHERPRGKIARFEPTDKPQSGQRPASVRMLAPRDIEKAAASLLALDSSIANTATARGTAEAFDQFADPQVRIHRPGSQPIMRRQPAVRELRREPGSPRWEPTGGGVARSGDLGYTWGAVRWLRDGAPAERGYYVRIWRRSPDGWLIVLDAVTPGPSGASPSDQTDAPPAG